MRKLLPLTTALILGTATAVSAQTQDPRVAAALTALASGDPVEAMAGATGLCLLGALDAPWTISAFGAAGWQETERFETTVTYASGDLAVLIQHGQQCRVMSALSTRKALTAALDVFPLVSVDMRSEGSVMGCSAMRAQERFYVSVNSGGQDPTCESETNSDIVVVPAR